MTGYHPHYCNRTHSHLSRRRRRNRRNRNRRRRRPGHGEHWPMSCCGPSVVWFLVALLVAVVVVVVGSDGGDEVAVATMDHEVTSMRRGWDRIRVEPSDHHRHPHYHSQLLDVEP
jgi:hypothetical protein